MPEMSENSARRAVRSMLPEAKPWLAMLCLLGALVTTGRIAAAADLSAEDIAWIDTCIADRKIEQLDPVKLRKYCECMQQIVDDNEPFTVSELEHSYPPADVMCHDAAGLGQP
jgi:hypothetical protein